MPPPKTSFCVVTTTPLSLSCLSSLSTRKKDFSSDSNHSQLADFTACQWMLLKDQFEELVDRRESTLEILYHTGLGKVEKGELARHPKKLAQRAVWSGNEKMRVREKSAKIVLTPIYMTVSVK